MTKHETGICHSNIHSSFVIRASSFSLHFPVFQQFVWDFFQKPRGPLEYITESRIQSHMRITEVKFVTRASDRDVKEAAFFFNGIARFERARAGKHSVGQPDHEYSVKFQAFRLVHR